MGSAKKLKRSITNYRVIRIYACMHGVIYLTNDNCTVCTGSKILVLNPYVNETPDKKQLSGDSIYNYTLYIYMVGAK